MPTPADNSWSIKRAISLSHLCLGWLNVWPWAVQLLPVCALPAPLPLLSSDLLLIARVRGDPPFNLEKHTDNRLTILLLLLLLICGCHTENQISMFWIHSGHRNCEWCESECHTSSAFPLASNFLQLVHRCVRSTMITVRFCFVFFQLSTSSSSQYYIITLFNYTLM